MNGEIQPLVTDWLTEFEKEPFQFQDLRPITAHFRGMYGIYFDSSKKI